MSLSDKNFFEEDDKQDNIVLKSFWPEFSYEYSFHKIGTTILHHSLLTKIQECKEFLSASSLKIRIRQSMLSFSIYFCLLFFRKKERKDLHIYNFLFAVSLVRSEERRVGKECRSRWS